MKNQTAQNRWKYILPSHRKRVSYQITYRIIHLQNQSPCKGY